MAVSLRKKVTLTDTFEVGSGKTVTENRVVKIVTGGLIENSDSATASLLGVALEDGTGGDNVKVQLEGIATIAASDSAVNAGEYLISDADGKVDTLPSADGDHVIIGKALADAEAEDDLIPVHLRPQVDNSNDAA